LWGGTPTRESSTPGVSSRFERGPGFATRGKGVVGQCRVLKDAGHGDDGEEEPSI
jgi:hypothetical protein